MDRISSLLPKVLQKRGLQAQATASHIVHIAQEWLRQALPQFSADLHVERYSDATLYISAAHSIAAQECQQVLPLLKIYLQKEGGVKNLEGIQLTRAR
ncbi:MAG: hypothetical protein JWM56_119 [Candidatus Peribacteria bacterium]|nr:hypothetical protein [Candidatus Peribacteria bacterium]